MRTKLISYDLKNGSAPGTKAKKFKGNNKNFSDRKKVTQIKDKRKLQNDKTISEAEKMAHRMDFENMINKTKSHNSGKDQIFSSVKDDKKWETDPLLLKLKQLGRYDEGIDESSDDDDDRTNNGGSKSSRCVADGHTAIKHKKKTLEETIRESKLKKAEKRMANEKDSIIVNRINDEFKNKISQNFQKICMAYERKKIKGGSATVTKNDLIDVFEENFQTYQIGEKPERNERETMGKLSEKKNDKLVSNKVDRLKEHLKKAKIINDKGEVIDNGELNASDLESDEEECEDEEDEQESDEDEEENEEECEDEKNEDECEEDEEEFEEHEEENEVSIKKDISSNISKKRMMENDDQLECKRIKVDNNEKMESKNQKLINDNADNNGGNEKKNPVDCLRVLMQMNLRKEIMLVLSSEIDNDKNDEESVTKKIIMATLLQEALVMNTPHCYSPELVRSLTQLLALSARTSEHWLCVTDKCHEMMKNDVLDICTMERENIPLLAISVIYHVVRLVKQVVACNISLASVRTLFGGSLKSNIDGLPIENYPVWLKEEISNCTREINSACQQVVPEMRVKKQFKIVELLEPDLEDKFDPKKNLTKILKNKIKVEKKSVKKEIKLNAQSQALREVTEARKNSAIRDKKTLAILNGLNQI